MLYEGTTEATPMLTQLANLRCRLAVAKQHIDAEWLTWCGKAAVGLYAMCDCCVQKSYWVETMVYASTI